MKKIGIFFLCMCAFPLTAAVGIISVTDEDKHSRKEDFYHTFEYVVQPKEGTEGGKCQATRIAPNWFVTAAHCVQTHCQKNCTIRLDLLEGPISAWVQTLHSPQKPSVFIHPKYKTSGKKILIQYDLALIYLDVNRTPKTYYRRPAKANQPYIILSEKNFSAHLDKNRRLKSRYLHALNPSLPPIAVFDNFNQILERKISVISIFDGVRHIELDPHTVYYVKDLQYAYTQNFGIRKGMSGSGVMTNTGELIGIISSNVGTNAYQGTQKIKHEDLFMFSVFNNDSIHFMQEVMGKDFNKISQKDAYPYLTQKTQKNFSSLISIMKSSDFHWHSL